MAEIAASVSLAASQVVPRGSLRASFSWTFFGNAVYSACQWGILILLAKLGSPELVGQYALGLAIVMPIISLSCLQLRQVIASDVREEYDFREYVGFRILTTALALLLIVAVSMLLRYDALTTWLILLIGFAQGVEALSDVFYARLQSLDRMDRIARSQIARGLLSLLALVVGLLLTGSVAWGIVGMILASTAVMFLHDLRPQVHSLPPRDIARPRVIWPEQLRPRFLLRQVGRLLAVVLPLGVVALLVNLSTNVPRYFIEHSLGRSELGIFSAVAFLMSAGNLVASALSQFAFVRMAGQFAAGHLREFRHLLLRLLGVGTVLGVGGIVIAHFAGSQLLTLLYRPEYARQPRLLVGLMVVAWLGYLCQFLGSAMTAARYFRMQVPLFAVIVLVIATSSFWLIPRHGLPGAVLSLLLGRLVQLTGSVAILLFSMRRRQVALAAEAAGAAV